MRRIHALLKDTNGLASAGTAELPSAQEARQILDATVYGMNEMKERLLEFLQSVRNSKNFAYILHV